MEKLLLISAIAPFPNDSGGANRIYQTIKYLSQKYEIYFLAFGENNLDEIDSNWLKKHCNFWQFFTLKKRSFISEIPYYFSCWQNDQIIEQIKQLTINNEFKKIRIEFSQLLYLEKYLPNNCQKVFVAHDISTISFERRLTKKENWLKRGFAFFNWWQIDLFEKKYLKRYDQVVAVSNNDKRILEKNFHLKKVALERNGIEKIDFLLKENHRKKIIKIGYLGSFAHPPNQQAVNFLLKHILPKLEEKQINYQFFLAGKGNKIITNEKIFNLGFTKTSRDFFQRIDVLVAPIFAGSGSRIKILEALSFGIPVITTKIGAEGIEIQNPYLEIVKKQEWTQLIENFDKNINQQALGRLKKQLQEYLWEKSFEKS